MKIHFDKKRIHITIIYLCILKNFTFASKYLLEETDIFILMQNQYIYVIFILKYGNS